MGAGCGVGRTPRDGKDIVSALSLVEDFKRTHEKQLSEANWTVLGAQGRPEPGVGHIPESFRD